ncbi:MULTISPECIES: BlaI/MecI/CopY family transcriptional regulator [unclassified Streptomyces]|uniref:BlaI/MecI/CopY family transcriptional regulator n=1 Tax=unclassified Streptomyces TaxID=2593676 RepID=UPI002DDAC3FD|nr:MULTISPECIES: BlaI/MecI/CopY family transcriptional regulator [unclassified Streptomyces]WSF82838.1 BlaI/MecI/CopY family transcriptional regulator [Streptomyces sp. NBC_01744]WSC40903.1 BlaI/MecI/CopY family transcriptional regulator [Streptomyces sp. NBC_01763]WSC49025.1 BlaI/MecI/CopY family transcriptional regulator [Streptomyces sp. NBC_01762]WSC51989.1 BlaI/MecI/CopY family transcriptional regulator [Streptomyces sp. NBC_01761]WSD28689.1 BlaI/MecI/CopY family transcriptional regulator
MDAVQRAGTHETDSRLANGKREAEVLAVLRSAPEPLTPRAVREVMDDDLSYSTVVTILTRLYEKDVLTRVPRGRAFAYAPATDEPGFAARRMRQAMEEVPDRETVLTRFVDDLSSGDEALLRRLLGGDLDSGR